MSDSPNGEPAGELGPHGYLWIEIDGVNYTAQDLAKRQAEIETIRKVERDRRGLGRVR
jgi:hypothetical protein